MLEMPARDLKRTVIFSLNQGLLTIRGPNGDPHPAFTCLVFKMRSRCQTLSVFISSGAAALSGLARSPRRPLQQIAHHRLLRGRGLVGDDELLDAERSAGWRFACERRVANRPVRIKESSRLFLSCPAMSAVRPPTTEHGDSKTMRRARSRHMQCSINCNGERAMRGAERPPSAWRFPRGRVLCQGGRPIKGREFIFQPAAECLDLRAIAAALGTHEVVGAACGQRKRNWNHQLAAT